VYIENVNSINDYKPVFNWFPDNYQWWITGFDCDPENTPSVTYTYMIAVIDFNQSKKDIVDTEDVPVPEMYNNFVAAQKTQEGVSNDWKYVIKDDENKRVYIIWGSF